MADRLANIAMDTGAFIQEHDSAEANIVEAATAFLDNDVNHLLETSHAEYQEPQSPRDDATEHDHFETRISAPALGCPRTCTTLYSNKGHQDNSVTL